MRLPLILSLLLVACNHVINGKVEVKYYQPAYTSYEQITSFDTGDFSIPVYGDVNHPAIYQLEIAGTMTDCTYGKEVIEVDAATYMKFNIGDQFNVAQCVKEKPIPYSK